MELIQDIIKICPHFITHAMAWTPLHLLLFRSDTLLRPQVKELVILLIEIDPKVLMTAETNYGQVAIHLLFNKVSITQIPSFLGLIRSIIELCPECVAVENYGGVTPFQSFWHNFTTDDYGRSKLGNPEYISLGYYNQSEENDRYSVMVWKCVVEMIRYTGRLSSDSGDENQPFMPLHAIASSQLSKLQHDIMTFAVEIHNREINRRDRFGNLPLHCACRHNNIENALIVLTKNPNAARARNADGDLPLFLALEDGKGITWENGWKELVEANMDALSENDRHRQVYPFMIVASLATDVSCIDRWFSLDCLFEIILLRPDLISMNLTKLEVA